MKIGVPKEVKNNEFRVGLTPDSVGELSFENQVYVEKDAGRAIVNPGLTQLLAHY